MMEIFVNEGNEWLQVQVKNGCLENLWMKVLNPTEKAELLDRIGKGDVKVKNVVYIRKGH
jgi:hypothetical protein